jgi:hypothetical protein
MFLSLTGDRRLVGTWRSDLTRTAAEIAARNDIPDPNKAKLTAIFGKLELRYTRWRCYSTFEGTTESSWYRVAAKDVDSVVIVNRSDVVGRVLYHVHFEDEDRKRSSSVYWIALGRFREFFHRVQ